MQVRERYILILAATKREGYQYAKRTGLPARRYRIPIRAAQVDGVRVADIHVLPSFKTSHQRHAILSRLRQVRGICDLRFIDVAMPPAPDVVEDQGDGMGPQLTIFDMLKPAEDEADRMAAFPNPFDEFVEDPDPAATLGEPDPEAYFTPKDEEELAAEFDRTRADARAAEEAAADAVRRRRTRCKDCGTLHFKTDSCPVDPDAELMG